jgi:HD-GYP domain-containing protein (c-di-GMP phosphodiesterase class II)
MVTEYAVMVATRLDELYVQGRGGEAFDQTRIEQLRLAAGLHDIGKMIVPLSVMNKSTRLDGSQKEIEDRFAYLRLLYERDMLRGEISRETYDEKIAELNADQALIKQADSAGFLSDDMLASVNALADHCYRGADGSAIPYVTEQELTCLRVRKGTLTAEERAIMEGHATMTKDILAQVYFTDTYKNALLYASEHHEYLDGSGYPNHLQGEALSTETRILTAVDIYDALTCTDRPYKKPMPREKAISILQSMVQEGKLDATVVSALDDVTRRRENGGGYEAGEKV